MAAIPEVFSTGGQSTLNGSILSGATSLVVTAATSFPTSGTFRLKIDSELFKVTAVSGTTFTVVGAQEGTSAAAHSNAATVTEELTAAALTAFQSDTLGLATQGDMPGGKLTLTTGTPVLTADVTSATNVYYTPFRSNVIALWDGGYWQRFTFSELTLALSGMTANIPNDVFGYISGGALAIEKLAWTNATTRATAISIQDGRYCKTGDKTRLYLGSFVPTASTTTEDSEAKPFLFNAYHAAPRRHIGSATDANNYTSTSAVSATISASLTTSVFVGLPQIVDSSVKLTVHNDSDVGQDVIIGLLLDGTTDYDMAAATNDHFGYYAAPVTGSRGIPMAAGLHSLTLRWRLVGTGSMVYSGGDRGGISTIWGTQISCLISR